MPQPGTRRRIGARLAGAATLACLAVVCGPGLASAVIPRSATYSFLSPPTDQLGFPGFSTGTEITPTGEVYTGWGELVPRIGPSLRAFSSRGRSLEGGRMPIVRGVTTTGGVLYVMTIFETSVRGVPVDYVRIDLSNPGRAAARGVVSVALRYTGGRFGARGLSGTRVRLYRFPRPATSQRDGLYFQPGAAFNANWQYAYSGQTVTRDGLAMLMLPSVSAPATQQAVPRTETTPPVFNTSFARTDYTIPLAPGAHAQLDFKLPVVPLDPASDSFTNVVGTSFDAARAQTVSYWRRVLGQAMRIDVPERKVEDAFYASLANTLLSRYRTAGGLWVQAVNNLRYHAFWLRDSAIITRAYDLVGLHRQAGENLPFFLTWQQPDGMFISRDQEFDGHGQALWAFAEHYRRTRNITFARTVYPAVKRAMDWLDGQRGLDPLHLTKAVERPLDNELITGHVTGDNFWGLAGVHGAIDLANAVGARADAQHWTDVLRDYRAKLDAAVRAAAVRTHGYIPPSLDVAGGQDWGNLWASYPEPVYPPDSPLVTNTLRHARREFREGISTYADGRLLHGYLGFRVFETELLRGEQKRVVRGLYDELAHTTGSHGGFEAGTAPFGRRAVEDSTVPHGWFAAEYVTLLRNMLVREQGRSLVLLGAVPPIWLREGEHVSVAGAPTLFGPVSFTLTGTRDGAVLRWRARVGRGVALRWPVPAWVRSVSAAGLSRDRRTIRLSGRRGTLRVRWRLARVVPSYESSFRALLARYRSARNSSAAAPAGPLSR
jgi:hypothetical protein